MVEKYRAKKDIWNGMISGCIVGGSLAARQGIGAMGMGCVGFAAFSLVMENIMHSD